MSAVDIPRAPWGGEQGRYLASVEVPEGTEATGDWKLWTVPAMTWMHMPCRMHTIGQVIEQARGTLRHDPEWWWEGSVHELYPAGFRNPAVEEFELVFGLLPR